MAKTKYNRSKKHHKSKKTVRKRSKKGGETRREKIIVTLGREHTSPDIVSIITVEKGPNTYDTKHVNLGESRLILRESLRESIL